MGITDIRIFGDSQLVIKKINGDYQAKHDKLSKYKDLTMSLLEKFNSFTIDNISRKDNWHADAIASVNSLISPSDPS